MRRDSCIEGYIIKHIGIPDITNENLDDKTNVKKIPKYPIWFLWLQGLKDMPDIVRLCYKNAKKFCGYGTVILLTKDSLKDYIELPEFVVEKYNNGTISNTHLSDIIRFRLLAHYGGGWMDSTILLTQELPQQIFQSSTYCIKYPRKDQFVFKGRWSIFFWIANNRKLPQYIYHYLIKYYEIEDRVIDYFLTDYLIDIAYREIPEFREEIDNIPLNNPCSTQLKVLMDKPFNKAIFDALTTDTWAFKLSYKGFPKELSKIPGTFYDYIFQS